MKIINAVVLLNISLLFTICVSGQTNSFPNELKRFELYQKGKLQRINLLVSKEKDIKKAFGKNCNAGCDYDENWTISFSYIRKSDYISETDEGGNVRKFYPPRKYVGTLISIRFHPKKHISIDSKEFSPSFRQIIGYDGISNQKESISAIKFSDQNGLEYNISQKDNPANKYQKGDVISIEYGITETRKEEIFGVTGYYEKKNKRFK
jgi:hypothetical protein